MDHSLFFCPILVKDALHGDVSDFSIAISAFGVGGLLGAIALLGVDATYDRRRLTSHFASLYGLHLILAALNLWISLLPVLIVVLVYR